MTSMDEARDLARLQEYIDHHIPLVRAMQVRAQSYSPAAGLELTAPLAPNSNHQGTAFGGSLHGIATLAAWGFLWLSLADQRDLHLVVRESRVDYRRAVTGALVARCPPPAAAAYRKFCAALARRGKAAIGMKAEIVQNGGIAAEFSGRFVAVAIGRRGKNVSNPPLPPGGG